MLGESEGRGKERDTDGETDREGRVMNTMTKGFFQYSRLVTPFRQKRIEREKESKVTKIGGKRKE